MHAANAFNFALCGSFHIDGIALIMGIYNLVFFFYDNKFDASAQVNRNSYIKLMSI